MDTTTRRSKLLRAGDTVRHESGGEWLTIQQAVYLPRPQQSGGYRFVVALRFDNGTGADTDPNQMWELKR